MPARSKFTAQTRERVIEALRLGASHRTAAAIAGISDSQIARWLKKGEDSPGGQFRDFYEAVRTAESEPRLRALGVIWKAMPERPDIAWKFIERREPGFEPPERQAGPLITGPVTVTLRFSDGTPVPELPSSTVNVVEQDSGSDSA